MLGHDPHRYQSPTLMETRSDASTVINKRGYGPDGETVWLHGPEPLGPRGGARFALRARSWKPGDAWNLGCSIIKTLPEALEAFHARVYRPAVASASAPTKR